ncbi:MAG: FecR family protein [Pyrinomonadaceae bacterium]|jgi:hypothetical protein|nr:FecR family protein [Pyrinomonadaceae bacterium]
MNENKKYKRFYVDWWTIKRSTIYGVIFLLLALSGLSYGLWYASHNNWFLDSIVPEAPKDTARIASFEGDVRIIRASTREIERVNNTTFIAAGDTIQTQADGKAEVQMADGSTLTVRPNSTAIIRDNSSLLGGTSVRVALGGGQINVKTEAQSETSNNIVEVRQSENKILAQTEASFGINQTNNTGEIRINRGTVESKVGNQTAIIKDGEFTSVNNGTLTPKEKIIASPRPISPSTLEQFFVGDSNETTVTLRWQKVETTQASSFMLEVATSPFFVADTIVFQKDGLTIPNLSVSKLQPSNYFWRVRSVSISGQMSEWSEPWKFTVAVRDEKTSLRADNWGVENIGGNLYLISGKTAAGATIRILGRETFAISDGTFKLQVAVPANNVAIEIKDEQGGRSVYSLNLKTVKATQTN